MGAPPPNPRRDSFGPPAFIRRFLAALRGRKGKRRPAQQQPRQPGASARQEPASDPGGVWGGAPSSLAYEGDGNDDGGAAALGGSELSARNAGCDTGNNGPREA